LVLAVVPFSSNHVLATNRTIDILQVNQVLGSPLCETGDKLLGTVLFTTLSSGTKVSHYLEFQKLDLINSLTNKKIGQVRANVVDLTVTADGTLRAFQANGLLTCIGIGQVTPVHIGITYENGYFHIHNKCPFENPCIDDPYLN
jgi:hypothetical protein